VQLSTADVARLTSGTVEGPGDLRLTGAEVDSRSVRPGDLFVALRGARCDGHAFVTDALSVAAAALVRYDAEFDAIPSGRGLIRVEDPLTAYWELARHERRSRRWRVAAITGSVGKTTTKEMLTAILEPTLAVGSTAGNRNSTLGLPAEVLSQPEDIEVFVAEAGMSRAGELDTIGSLITPQVLLYTRIAAVHTEFFPDIEGIVRAKAELLPHLDPEGTLVINGLDPHQRTFPDATPASVLRFGTSNSDARLSDLEDLGLLGTRFRLHLPSGTVKVRLGLAGRHQAENLLAAATAAEAFGVGAGGVAAVVPTLEAAPHRGRIHRFAAGFTLVDDSYNASPIAMRRLLEMLAGAKGRRVAVLGEMYELGEISAEEHRKIGRKASKVCDLLVTVGGDDAAEMAASARSAGLRASAVHHVGDAEAVLELVESLFQDDDVVLVKGSRGVGLDRTVDALLDREAA
jgi:UDP-N-acetylmuramoyl-tripeptide--D-alanyl-D-alanine ligase